ncbi:Fic family protein [Corticicoccus populi]|uniref:Fic family protein n=1 Tax=Corticicoccus populi TaxID=1812821 RepID=A0ABW5WYD1_9STAP
MNKYYPLDKLFHIDSDNHEKEYLNRWSQLSAYKTDIHVTPIKKGVFAKETVPLFLVNIPDLAEINEEIIENSNKITLLKNQLPTVSQDDFYSKLLINEIQSTNEVENVRSTKKEISDVLEDIKHQKFDQNTIAGKRFIGLTKLYYFLEQEGEINKVEDIRAIYDELVDPEIKEEDKLDGDIFRKDSVSVDSSGIEIHKGVMSEARIISMLGQMITFVNNEKMPYLYKLMFAHYLFEYIHPFYDGNGRMGRYIVCKSLSKKLDKFSAVTFSYIVNRHKNKYYKAFTQASNPLNKGELTFFVKDMLEMIQEGQEQVITILEENIQKIDRISQNIDRLNLKDFGNQALFILSQSAIFQPQESRITVNNLAEVLNCERRKVLNALSPIDNKLVKVKAKPLIYTLSDELLDFLLD